MIPRDVLKRLHSLNAENKLVLFVGAGISYNARHVSKPKWRIPMWTTLAKRIAKDAGLSYADYNDVLDLFDGVRIEFGRGFLEERVSRYLNDSEFTPSKVHEAIVNSGISTIYTTNYDSLLERGGHFTVISKEADYDRQKSDVDRFIYQIHGNLSDVHTLTKGDYRTWAERCRRAELKLTQLLSEKSFLFVGYSLRDPHLTDGILPFVQRMLGDRQHPHYAWMWDLNDGPRKVLLERDGIEAHSIENDDEWIEAFNAIACRREFRTSREATKAGIQHSNRSNEKEEKINAYKLYYYRNSKKIALRDIASRAGLTVPKYKSLERIANLRSPPSVKNFKSIPREVLQRLEDELGCQGQLRVNGQDDLRAVYIEYYIRNRTLQNRIDETEQNFLQFETKAVVFDFDGTLTISRTNETTWESLWMRLGYDISECAKYHSMYSSKRITHRRWCEITRDHFRARQLTRSIVKDVASNVKLAPGAKDVITELKNRNIPIYVVSGSIKEIIRYTLGDLSGDIDELHANSFTYDSDDIIESIESTKFDFEGKAEFINRLADDKGISTAEVLFVGNSINDEFAARSGARTLCVNPSFTNPDNRRQWNYAIRRMENLMEIIPYTIVHYDKK